MEFSPKEQLGGTYLEPRDRNFSSEMMNCSIEQRQFLPCKRRFAYPQMGEESFPSINTWSYSWSASAFTSRRRLPRQDLAAKPWRSHGVGSMWWPFNIATFLGGSRDIAGKAEDCKVEGSCCLWVILPKNGPLPEESESHFPD